MHTLQEYRRRRTTFLIAAIVTLAMVLVAVVLPATADEESVSCDEFVWTPPRALMSPDGEPIHVERPSVVDLGDAVWLMAVPTHVTSDAGVSRMRTTDSVALLAGVRWRPGSTATPIPHPPVSSYMYQPLTVRAGTGVDVLWTEMDTTSGNARPGRSIIWYAHVDSNLQWTTPDSLILRETLSWGSLYNSNAAYGHEATYVLAPLHSVFNRDTVLLLSRANSRWTTDERVVARVAYSGLAAFGDSSLLVSYVTAAFPDDGGTLFVKRSSDGGQSWSDTLRVSPPGDGLVYDPRLVMAGDTLVYLVWRQLGHDGSRNVARIATSRDSGLTWLPLTALDLGGDARSLDAAADGQGRLHVVAGVVLPESAPYHVMVHASWQGDSLTSIASIIPSSAVASTPSISSLLDGGVLLTWGAMARTNGEVVRWQDFSSIESDSNDIAWATFHVIGRQACSGGVVDTTLRRVPGRSRHPSGL